ncbi:hypothetical protein Micbo1qcDRAFT_162979 [Microdochium bolleyi]|uniref:Uncharacterized protein n=1 Tax=Microdochium bolleyi TaxID=196109 RepID=A0A136J239_9PEZI|nr:hypothetical protein Micbo1qcDRAFT_162979 [Microdochium bolleyi]
MAPSTLCLIPLPTPPICFSIFHHPSAEYGCSRVVLCVTQAVTNYLRHGLLHHSTSFWQIVLGAAPKCRTGIPAYTPILAVI